MKYEYDYVVLKFNDMIETLEEYGNAGWELVSVVARQPSRDTDSWAEREFYFKRPICLC